MSERNGDDARELVADSGLFDAVFYLWANPDVAAVGADPLGHYMATGAEEGRDPHPLFQTRYYLSNSPDLAPGTNPLVHYLLFGGDEKRDPHPLFSARFYVERYPEVAVSGLTPLAHYVLIGAGEGLDPHPLFSTRHYQAQRALAEAGLIGTGEA